jgi:bifunctional N-acetylglucosamine-1-phosphate-uridyltransferase/glucosamine-1-phosphate-acetyltransferase GlmU-like protein
MIGAHSEVARSLFQEGASTHSGYFGDSIFDRGARAGAGTITANVKAYRDEIKPLVKGKRIPTGLSSLGAVVGAEAQLGIGVKTMPGALIGACSFVGPGAIVDENVPSDARYFVKQEKIIKKGKKRRSNVRP